MVWSENAGVSIVLPSDHVDGDGRNYIVIGEDVPAPIATDFSVALVFHNGSNPDVPMYGFDWFAIGFSKNGSLDLMGYFYQWTADPSAGGVEQFYRQSFLSAAPPSGIDKPAILSLGSGIYTERGVNIKGFTPGWQTIGLGDSSYAFSPSSVNVWVDIPGMVGLIAVPANCELEVILELPTVHNPSGGSQIQLIVAGVVTAGALTGSGSVDTYIPVTLHGHIPAKSVGYNAYIESRMLWMNGTSPGITGAAGVGPILKARIIPCSV